MLSLGSHGRGNKTQQLQVGKSNKERVTNQSMNNPQTLRKCTTEFSVRYAETDAMAIVHHANYLVYFEEGRSHYMRQMGYDYALFEKEGFQLPVTEVHVRYGGSLCYGQRVKIQTWVLENLSRRLSFSYEIFSDTDSRCLVSGTTSHIWTNSDGKVIRQPQRWQELYADFCGET
jgi:acyl-CoA thioester hydrolase